VAKLYLKFEQAVLKEFTLAQAPVTIGRLPDNVIQIDNLAVSGHHARVVWEADHYVVEDNNSLNGTYVNNARINRVALKDSDSILIGKHVLAFQDAVEQPPKTHANDRTMPMQGLDATVVMTSRSPHAGLDPHLPGQPAFTPPGRERIGVLTVMDGKTDESQYTLASKLTVIGKSDMASIKLKGWFAPKVAANVMKRDGKYIIAAAERDVRVKVNGAEITGQHELNDGETIEVAGITFTFTYQE
jgi:predicted component of type VI protein secretion system